ncbi:lipocalin-like domain-containing protein [Candidatus Chlorohelix sp.]|uniref:lipocalin-like domain-containing protein n=1 Tax=Candidatus Chlorohelix sp. TaxID=3139201 RepID=UPI003144DF88
MKTLKYKIALFLVLVMSSLLLVACGDNAPTKEAFPSPSTNAKASEIPVGTPGPVPGTVVKFPEDEAPHNVLTEWWYYTGRIKTADGQQYGVEFVIFQGLRSNFPAAYASHFAITNVQSGAFKYEQRISISDSFKAGGSEGFNLKVNAAQKADWTMQGIGGKDSLKAAMDDGSYAIDLTVNDTKGIALHGGGQFSYGPAGASYYYSRPRMSVSGTISVGGTAKQISSGQMWFDKQWGNFLPLAGGWDWFSAQLNDGSELMFYNLRDKNNNLIQVFGTYVPPCKDACTPNQPHKIYDLETSDLTIKANGEWVSNATGVKWPSGWAITVKEKPGIPAMTLNYKPVLPNQELDTRKTTAVVYWEGDTDISGTKDGKPITGSGYVELTGYDIGANNK